MMLNLLLEKESIKIFPSASKAHYYYATIENDKINYPQAKEDINRGQRQLISVCAFKV